MQIYKNSRISLSFCFIFFCSTLWAKDTHLGHGPSQDVLKKHILVFDQAYPQDTIEIRRENCGITGPIGEDIAQLQDLETLHVPFNRIKMPSSDIWTKLRSLTSVNLSFNPLCTEFHPSLCTIKTLQRLKMYASGLTGSIPPSIGHLTRLREVNLAWNHLEGKVPRSLQHLTHLTYLNLSCNGPEISSDLASEDDPTSGLFNRVSNRPHSTHPAILRHILNHQLKGDLILDGRSLEHVSIAFTSLQSLVILRPLHNKKVRNLWTFGTYLRAVYIPGRMAPHYKKQGVNMDGSDIEGPSDLEKILIDEGTVSWKTPPFHSRTAYLKDLGITQKTHITYKYNAVGDRILSFEGVRANTDIAHLRKVLLNAERAGRTKVAQKRQIFEDMGVYEEKATDSEKDAKAFIALYIDNEEKLLAPCTLL